MPNLKPSFFIVGAAKAGTTELAKRLSDLDSIFLPAAKELQFFNKRPLCSESISSYEANFYTEKEAKIAGEASPQYSLGMMHPFTMGRLSEYCPEAKLIYIVRDPIIRLQSHILQLANCGKVFRESPEKVIQLYPETVEASLYRTRLKEMLNHFPKRQILVIQFESLVDNQSDSFSKVVQFLGVPNEPSVNLPRKNISANHLYDRPLMQVFRKMGLGTIGRKLPPGLKSRLIHAVKRREISKPLFCDFELATLRSRFVEESQVLWSEWGLDKSLWTFDQKTTGAASIGGGGYEGSVKL